MSEQKTSPSAPLAEPWGHAEIMAQVSDLVNRVYTERRAQEQRWGPQDKPMIRRNSDGSKETGRAYRQWESIMKYQCDRAFADGHGSMDLVLLEEVFEALAALVLLDDIEPLDVESHEIYEARRAAAVKELIQVAAVAVKMAGQLERNY